MNHDPGKEDSFTVYIITLSVLLVIAILTIDYYIEYLIAIWRYIRIGEFWLLRWIPEWVPILGSLPIDDAYQFLLDSPELTYGEGLVIEEVKAVDNATMKYFSVIPGIFFMVVGIRAFLKERKIAPQHNHDSLLRHNAQFYPHLEQFVKENPDDYPLRFDPEKPETSRHGISISPERYCTMAPPPELFHASKARPELVAPIWDGLLGFDHDLANRAFEAQLGKTYSSLSRMTGYEKEVFDQLCRKMTYSKEAIGPLVDFAFSDNPTIELARDKELVDWARATRDQEQKKSSLARFLSGTYFRLRKALPGPLYQDRIDRFLKIKELEPMFKRAISEQIMNNHGFVITGLMSLLQEVRRGGVVAGSDFLWVKAHNRTLFYALNSVGRKTTYTESAGPFSHWLLELHMGRALSQPSTYEAVKQLAAAIKHPERVMANEESQYSRSGGSHEFGEEHSSWMHGGEGDGVNV